MKHSNPFGPQPASHRKNAQGTLWLWAGAAAAVFALAFAGFVLFRAWHNRVELGAEKDAYYHYEIVTLRLRANDRKLRGAWAQTPPVALVTKDGQPVTTVGDLRAVTLRYDAASDAWTGQWPVPWNAPDGEYVPSLGAAPELEKRVRLRPFRIVRRVPRALPQGFVAVDIETDKPLRTMKVRGPDGTTRGWDGLLDWAQSFHGDAVWVLAGITPGVTTKQTWLQYNLPVFQEMGRQAHARGLKFGVYAMCYLTAKRPPTPRYEYAREYADGKMKPTRSISLRDPNRPGDLIEFFKPFAAMPEVDFIGLDYIRNAIGGYELADDFYREMPGAEMPAGWSALTPEQRMMRFEHMKVQRTNRQFIDRWQWWRAHKVAGVVRRIRDAIGPDKTLWAFTLGWQRGWQHGQDPPMMNDAGIDVDSVMLYEATRPQFEWMVHDWRSYVSTKDVQLIVADVIDWPLHQYTVQPSGPEDYARRMREAIDGMYADGRVKGIFIHDLSRLLSGRKGPYSTEKWAEGVREAVRYLRQDKTASPPVPVRHEQTLTRGRVRKAP